MRRSKLTTSCLLVIVIAFVQIAQSQDNEPELPSHLPGPPEDPPQDLGNAGMGMENGNNNEISNEVQPNGPLGPPPPFDENKPAPPPVPFGFNHIVLIMVPQLKFKLRNLTPFFGTNCKISLPITVFFEKLKAHPPLPPPPYPDSPYYGPYFPGGHYVRKRSVRHLLQMTRSGDKPGQASKPDLDLDDARFRAERVTLIPKLGNLLDSLGLGGKACLLRTICEVHEFPLQHEGYGIVGELFSMFFSISRSAFAESHLQEYLEAEKAGKDGDCRKYTKECSDSLFYWEKAHGERTNGSNYDEEELDTMLLEEVLMQ